MTSILPKLLGYDDAPKPCGQASRLTLANLRSKLGEGPMRFAPRAKERSIRDQLDALSPSQRDCLDYIKGRWESKYPEHAFTDEMYLRFARCSSTSPGEPFSDRSALKTMKKYPRHYQYLTAATLEQQLRSKTVFPVPKLSTIDGHEVCYMRPSRCAAKTAESREVMHSLAYALSTMVEREAPCMQGVAFLANMDDFTMSNFATDYWFQFMSILQGNLLPVRVNLFLIVNPPEWFGTIWNIMKTMSTSDFQERVKMISEFELPQYLAAGYEEFLPNDLTTGEALTDELVGDFVEYRKAIEAAQGHNNNNNNNTSLARQQSMRRGSGSSSSRDLGSSFNFNSSFRRSSSFDDSDSSFSRHQMMTKNTSNRAMMGGGRGSSSSRDLGSSFSRNVSLRRSSSFEDDSDGTSLRHQMTKSTSSSRAIGASEKPARMSNKQRPPGTQKTTKALALDARMNMSMPCLISRQKSAKRHSSEKTTANNKSQIITNKPNMVRDHPGDNNNDDNDNSDSSLNLFDLEKTSDDNNMVDTSNSENTGTVEIMTATAMSSASRLPSTRCW